MQKYMLVDDIDGTENAETVRFGIDGQSYEIDLAGENLEKFYVALDKYVNVARKAEVSHVARRASRRGTGTRASRQQVKPLHREDTHAEDGPSATITAISGEDRKPTIREWADANGVHIGARGRIAKTIQDQYDAAMAEAR